jgi:hypothetical protein
VVLVQAATILARPGPVYRRPAEVTLLEKRFIVTSDIYYCYRLIIVADTNNGGLSAGLHRSILKIGLVFGIDRLSRPTSIL